MTHEVERRSGFGVKLDPTVNYGHIISASVFLVSAGIAWSVMTTRIDAAERRLDRLERDAAAARDASSLESQLIARLDEKLSNLDRVMQRIERILDSQPSRRTDAGGATAN